MESNLFLSQSKSLDEHHGTDQSIYFNAYLINTPQLAIQPEQTNAIYNLNSPLMNNPQDYRIGLVSMCIPDQYIPLLHWNDNYGTGIFVATGYVGPTGPASYTGTYGYYTGATDSYIVVGASGYTGSITGPLLFEALNPYVSDASLITPNLPVFSVDQLCDIFNSSMVEICTNVNKFYPGLITMVPRLFFDENSTLFKLYIGKEFDSYDTLRLVVNKLWYSLLFQNFNTFIDFGKQLVRTGCPSDFFNIILCRADFNNSYTGPIDCLVNSASGPNRVLAQKHQSYQTTNQIFGVRVKMSQTPIRSEKIVPSGSTWTAGNDNTLSLSGENVLIDLINQTSNWNDQGKLTYTANLISYHNIESKYPLQRFNVELYYVDTQNNQYNLGIPTNYMASLKFEFRKIKV